MLNKKLVTMAVLLGTFGTLSLNTQTVSAGTKGITQVNVIKERDTKPLSDVKFNIINKNANADYDIVTNIEGKATIDLKDGTYTLTEIGNNKVKPIKLVLPYKDNGKVVNILNVYPKEELNNNKDNNKGDKDDIGAIKDNKDKNKSDKDKGILGMLPKTGNELRSFGIGFLLLGLVTFALSKFIKRNKVNN